MKKILALVAAVAAFGCLAKVPLKVAVFVDDGARSIGAYRWVELTARAKGVVAMPVDGKAVRNGALDAADVLVMPGGSSVDEAKSLGKEGREKIREFVRNGGGYMGTCAGCCLLMEPSKGHPNMIHMIPFKFSICGGKTDLSISFNRRAEELAGIKKGTHKVRYSEGPVPVPSIPVKDADVEVVATYNADVNAKGGPARSSMAGQAAAIAGTYGKGRLFVLSVHPEMDPDDWYILRGAFRFVSGREIEWDRAQRKRSQLAVGFMCDGSFGVETARLIQKLVTEGEFDMVPINSISVASGVLHNLDAVIAAPCAAGAKPGTGLLGNNRKRMEEFISRGGRVVSWGGDKVDPSFTRVADADAALHSLREFAATPAPEQAIPAKVEKPIRAGVYIDERNSSISIAKALAVSPEYEVKFLSPEDYSKGALDGIDLVLQPGGGSTSQYNALGEKGVDALKRFVFEGGKYYGVCAGAFLALQQSRPDRPRLGLVPFKGDDPSHYRGSSPIKVTLTDDGCEVFKGSAKSRTVLYGGGPAAIPGKPVEDADVKVLGKYAGRIINAEQPLPVEEMFGKAAFIGGRVGKGKVFISCPHPEADECTFDLVKNGVGFLTGVAPSKTHLDRKRGALAVRYYSSDKASAEFLAGTLCRDSRFHVLSGEMNSIEHVDAVVWTEEKMKPAEAGSLKRFIKRGGRVVIVADTEKKLSAAEKIKGAKVVDSYGKVLDELIAFSRDGSGG